jgi:hypothetical protein
MKRTVSLILALLFFVWAQPWKLAAQAPEFAKSVKYSQISPAEMKEWLTYLSSDELSGRQVFTEGYGLAAQYVADHLKEWGVKPLGDNGTYLQPVRLKGYKATRNSSVSVEANGQSETFKHGNHVTFGANSGGKQTVTFDSMEFLGYGLASDYQGHDVKNKLVVMIPNLATQGGGRGNGGGARNPNPIALGAKAVITFAPAPPPPTPAEQALTQAQTALNQANQAVAQAQQAVLAARGNGRGGDGQRGGGGGGGGRGRGGAQASPDFTTVQRVDLSTPAQFTGDEAFFEALFASGPLKFSDIKAKAEKGESISAATLPTKMTISIDNTYELISEQIAHNVVGMIEGTDPALKNTYVLIGAHLDHIGYNQAGNGRGGTPDACRRRSPAAQAAVVAAGKTVQRANTPAGGGGGGRGGANAPANTQPFDERDFISNGADDDGSGSTAELAVAKAFATGPKPKRSIVFVWHAGEESGLYGSRYNADFPVVPLDRVQAQLNMDMVGRDDCDNLEGDFTNTVFIVGADRISTDLHNVIIQTNNGLTSPLKLDYEMNDINDPESVYTRSDHYSYAQKGIPIAFFTTGLHPDYHRVTDSVEKITFPKMARIAQLVYETGFSIANTERILERDNKGPQTGFGSKAEVIRR